MYGPPPHDGEGPLILVQAASSPGRAASPVDRVCTKDGRVIPWADTVKGYEVRKGEFVVFEPEELKAVMPESDRKIRIEKFVYYLSLDPTYFGPRNTCFPTERGSIQPAGHRSPGPWTGCSRDHHAADKGVSRGGACLQGDASS